MSALSKPSCIPILEEKMTSLNKPWLDMFKSSRHKNIHFKVDNASFFRWNWMQWLGPNIVEQNVHIRTKSSFMLKVIWPFCLVVTIVWVGTYHSQEWMWRFRDYNFVSMGFAVNISNDSMKFSLVIHWLLARNPEWHSPFFACWARRYSDCISLCSFIFSHSP